MPIAWVLIAFTMRKCLRIRVDFDVAASLKSIADIIWAFRGRKTSNNDDLYISILQFSCWRILFVSKISRGLTPFFVVPVSDFNCINIPCKSFKKYLGFLKFFAFLLGCCFFVLKPSYCCYTICIDNSGRIIIFYDIFAASTTPKNSPIFTVLLPRF